MARIGPLSWVGMGLLLCAACTKVPLTQVHVGFTLADATWFEDEETLFVFYQVEADQGLGAASQLELSYVTDNVSSPWTPLAEIPPVHTHLPVDCGPKMRCGSTSLHVAKVPTQVRLQLRYHRDSALTLPATVALHVVGQGPPQTQRSLLVYGVFDASNTHVQWRERHQFPALRNEEVQALGLRRSLRIGFTSFGDAGDVFGGNPYGYAFQSVCPGNFTGLGGPPLVTEERALFATDALPLSASTAPHVCAFATVTDAKGGFTSAALAQKNPEVRAAFPSLHSPIKTDTELGFVLHPCQRTISAEHLAMQTQRLQLEGAPEICIDDWQQPGFADALAARFKLAIDQTRLAGNDMLLTVALHHDDTTGALAAGVEDALAQVLPFERDKSSPRVSGAFVFDSFGHALGKGPLRNLVLWCPAIGLPEDLDKVLPGAQTACALQPDVPDLKLGPFAFSNLPILPTRAQYLTFSSKYSQAQAGSTKSLTFRAPERTPLSVNFPLGDYGLATFFNNETIAAAPTDVFSFCAGDPLAGAVVFQTDAIPDVQPLALLPTVQQSSPQPLYALGIAWDFPFLMRLEYVATVAAKVTAFSVTVPFGISRTDQKYYGTELWKTGDFSLSDTLSQCTRFCDHPTFDSAGVYNVRALFRDVYPNACYRPRFPALGDGGFPRDP